MKTTLSAMLLAACSQWAIAQISHDLTVYADDGIKFTFIANGEQINAEPATRVKMENIEEDYVNAKVVFEDASTAPLEKKFLQIGNPDGDNKPVSAVWTIVKKDGEYKFKFASRTEKKIQPKETIIIQQEQDDPDIRIKVPGMEMEMDHPK